ncbi:MAG: MFS transporter [Nanoarchaeota archaeon]|nr:MFS transporter [Nanoarchaeota archaeon]MBU0977397.1 MFS transporter [Nanoarchaeota archaeon]
MKLFQKGELELLWPFYLDSLISPMFFLVHAFYIIYFINLGFSMLQIGVLIAMAPLFSLLFEIPTGAVADLRGRKFSVLLGNIIGIISVGSIFFFTNFYSIMLLMALAGFGATFSSGAHEAWTTDLINKENKSLLHNFFAKRTSLDSFGLVVSGFIGAILVKQFGLSIIWPISGISFFVSFIILAFGKEVFTKKKTKLSQSFRKINSQSIKSVNYARKHHVLFYFLLASLIFVIAGGFSSEISWVPLLKNLNFPEYAFGYLWSAIAVMGVIAPLVSSKLFKKGKEKNFLLTIMILLALITLPIIFVKNIVFAFLIIIPSFFLIYLSQPAERVFFHRYIPSKLRATIGSVESMILSIAAIIALPLVGLSVDRLGAKITIFLSGLLMIPAIIIFSRIKEKKPQP